MNNYPHPQQAPLPHERLTLWWKLQSKGKQIVLVVLLVGLLATCGLCSAVANAGKSQQSATPTPIPVATEMPTQAPTAKPTPTATPKPTPTPIPTPKPTPIPKPTLETHQIGVWHGIDVKKWNIGISEFNLDKGPITYFDENGSQESKAKDGNIFLVVKVFMQNKANTTQEVRNNMWSLKALNGQTYQSVTDLSYQDVAGVYPSKTLDSDLNFEVPISQKSFYMQFFFTPESKPELWKINV